ncbi:hypothetical protein BaRGS_00032658 [Batillaria attramentaria]|uniref:Uncharacterized protein n=1 Tax=Batillaria attramentaria TaxID=370345 RepID=A0ABD0JM98_9CAEN
MRRSGGQFLRWGLCFESVSAVEFRTLGDALMRRSGGDALMRQSGGQFLRWGLVFQVTHLCGGVVVSFCAGGLVLQVTRLCGGVVVTLC